MGESQCKLATVVLFIGECYLLFPHSLSFKELSVNSFRVRPFFSLNSCSFKCHDTESSHISSAIPLFFSQLRTLYCNAVKSQSPALQSFHISND